MPRKKKVQEEVVEVKPRGEEVTFPWEAEESKSQDRDELATLRAQVDLLTKALVTNRNVEQVNEDDESIGVMRVGGASLSAYLSDAYGRTRQFFWDHLGQVLYMTPAQYEELLDMPGGKRFFERGFLKLESEAASKLAIVDPAAYIESLSLDEVGEHFESIQDPAVLLRIVNFIDTTRILTEDAEGKPLVDSEGNPEAKVVALSPKYRLVMELCTSKLFDITGVQYSLIDG